MFHVFASLFHLGQSWVCSLIITIKELQNWLMLYIIIRHIWTSFRIEKKKHWSAVIRASCTTTHLWHQQKFYVVCYTVAWLWQNCSQKFVKWGHSLALESPPETLWVCVPVNDATLSFSSSVLLTIFLLLGVWTVHSVFKNNFFMITWMICPFLTTFLPVCIILDQPVCLSLLSVFLLQIYLIS